MSVYTQVSQSQLEAFLEPLDVGALVDYQGIEGGVVNSNYFINTEQGAYVLTLFEDLAHEDLPFFNELNEHLAQHGLPCAHPVANSVGETVFTLKHRPASLFTRLPGRHIELPDVRQCSAMGDVLGRLHCHVDDFPLTRMSDRDWAWFERVAEEVLPRLGSHEATLLRSELDWHRQHPLDRLPSGVIHGDLFRDNVLFDGDDISGVIDFYFASSGAFLYDLAITINDWCSGPNGVLDEARLHAFLSAYAGQRELTQAEHDNLVTALRLAAMRFWLSRLQESLFPAEGEMVLIKDPAEFEQILRHRRGLEVVPAGATGSD